jgi:hypothetical protein
MLPAIPELRARTILLRRPFWGGLSGKSRSRNVPLSPLSSKEIDRLDGLMVDRRLRAIFPGDIYTSGVRNRDRIPFSVIDWSEYSIPPLSGVLWCSHSLDRDRGTRSQSRITKRQRATTRHDGPAKSILFTSKPSYCTNNVESRSS